ncbi:MAG: hypothetical protein EXR05_08510 [Acetobacteraceae bacterium]|nr:hypothetical protein [Acetobacteraceae bacterium]MSP29344.1 hypothetical protein [Acetobacteraceae bacterium]
MGEQEPRGGPERTKKSGTIADQLAMIAAMITPSVASVVARMMTAKPISSREVPIPPSSSREFDKGV